MMTENENEQVAAVAPLVPDDVLDELMARVDAQGAELLGPDGLLSHVTKAVLERAMEEELTVILVMTSMILWGAGRGTLGTGLRRRWC
jgi:putative transposase